MVFIPRQQDNTEREIEQLLILSSFPVNEEGEDAREKWLTKLESCDSFIQLSFLKGFLKYILKNHFKILLEYYYDGYVLTPKQIKQNF